MTGHMVIPQGDLSSTLSNSNFPKKNKISDTSCFGCFILSPQLLDTVSDSSLYFMQMKTCPLENQINVYSFPIEVDFKYEHKA